MEEIKKLERRLNDICAQLNYLYEDKMYGSSSLDPESIEYLISELKLEYLRITDRLESLKKPNYSDGELDLLVNEIKSYQDKDVYYDIRLSNSPLYIGEIRVTYYNPTRFLGDIGYELKPEFRGNGYMIKALNVLREPLKEKGLLHPKFTVFPNNISSVKTIEKFGGKKIGSTGFYDIYQADLEEDNKKVR